MDWLWSVAWSLMMLTIVDSVRINPFTGLPDAPYDPVADYSATNQGSYLPNLPMTSIFPLMNDDLTAMMGLSSYKIPFVNPLMASAQQATLARPPSNHRNKPKNTRNNIQKNSNQYPPPQQPTKGRGVTLDIRGGGYKVDNQGPKPYKAPVSESSNRESQRYNNNNNGRKPGGQSSNNGSAPRNNRKPNQQRPRGPNMKNPYYNMKFESSSPSMPPNVEFVSPENVLPLHPRIYKQFLQQNKPFAAYLQNLRKQNGLKSSSLNNGGNFQKNGYNNPSNKPSGPKMTRNRGYNPIAQQSQISGFPNFPFSGVSSDMASQFGFLQQQQQNSDKAPNSPSPMDIFNQDPSFIATLSQTPEGQAYLAQMYQQHLTKTNKPRQNIPPRGPFKPPQQSITQSFPSSGMQSYQNMKHPSSDARIPSPNFFGQAHQNNDGSTNPPKIPTNEAEFQQMMMNFHQTMQQLSPSKQFLQATTGPPGVPTYKEQISPLGSNYPPNLPQYDQGKANPFGDYPYIPGHQESQSAFGKNTNTPYDATNFQSSYQASQSHVKSQPVNIGGYSMPPFSPMEPLASLENSNLGVQDYYQFQPTNHKYSNGRYHSGATALHEISPYSDDKAVESAAHHKGEAKSHQSVASESGYMTPEQLFAPQSTGLQSEMKFGYPSVSTSTSVSAESTQPEASSTILEHEGSERAALHLPEEVSIYVASQTDNPFLYEFTESLEPLSYEEEEKMKTEKDPSSEQSSDSRDSSGGIDSESDEELHESIQEFQKLLTKAPKNSYMVEPTEPTLTTKGLKKATTTRVPVLKKESSSDSEESKNHKSSYMFQYAPSEKSNSKPTPTWHAWKPNASKYHLPHPDAKRLQTTTPSTTTTLTTTVPPTTDSTLPPTQASYSTHTSFHHEPDTPICARYNNLTYCLQDPEYPKDQIKEAIEKNRHPLDHFLVDISASSNMVDDSLMFENSVPLQSTSVSYSFEGKAISPSSSSEQSGNDTAVGCSSNVYYAKPLRAINTAGLWKIIVNVEFEETGANYTQTVRIEECSHANGFVATCGTETISACLQQYKLYRLLAWESHRGFYIDAFLLPISCFCGSQQSR